MTSNDAFYLGLVLLIAGTALSTVSGWLASVSLIVAVGMLVIACVAGGSGIYFLWRSWRLYVPAPTPAAES